MTLGEYAGHCMRLCEAAAVEGAFWARIPAHLEDPIGRQAPLRFIKRMREYLDRMEAEVRGVRQPVA